MGPIIRSVLRAEIQQRMLDPTGGITATSDLNTWIDLADRTLWNAYAWPFRSKSTTLALTQGSKVLTLPADVQEVKKLINTDALGVLSPRNERWCQNLFPDDTQTATPMFYCDGGLTQASGLSAPPQRVLHIYPVPDRSYNCSLRYEALVTLRSAQGSPDSAYSCLPEDFDEALIQWVLTRYYHKVGDVAQSNLAQQSYQAELTRLISHYSSLTETFPMIDSELDSIYPGMYGVGWGGMS